MSIFKAYDIRGIYGEELTDELALEIGRAFATFTGARKVLQAADDLLEELSPDPAQGQPGVRGTTTA